MNKNEEKVGYSKSNITIDLTTKEFGNLKIVRQ